jgi:NAD(P)-dependent dehydrogenase (short-subunit alcohol dehydrogenase family)
MTNSSTAFQAIPTKSLSSGPVDLSTPIPYTNLTGKTILITGGANGIGAACGRHWSSHGANIVIGDVNEKVGIELIASLRQASNNQNHHFLPLDVTSWDSQVTFFRRAQELSPHGGIDAVIVNAGIADADEQVRFEEPPDYASVPADKKVRPPQMRTYDINSTGALYTTHLALSYLKSNPGSSPCSPNPSTTSPRDRHILLVSSMAGLIPLYGQNLYTVSKHAVIGLFRSLRLSAPQKTGVRVNVLCPYFTDTAILGPLGAVVLAGGGMARLESVIDAATRMVADHGIVGRGLCVGSKASVEDAKEVGLGEQVTAEGQEIWDVYAEDFEQSDLFTRRVIGITNLVTSARGWGGWFADIRAVMAKKIWG